MPLDSMMHLLYGCISHDVSMDPYDAIPRTVLRKSQLKIADFKRNPYASNTKILLCHYAKTIFKHNYQRIVA